MGEKISAVNNGKSALPRADKAPVEISNPPELEMMSLLEHKKSNGGDLVGD